MGRWPRKRSRAPSLDIFAIRRFLSAFCLLKSGAKTGGVGLWNGVEVVGVFPVWRCRVNLDCA
jgi:hypothetical protein